MTVIHPLDIGSVYFLQVGADGPIKVGFTRNDVASRVRCMQLGSPHVIRWIGYFAGTRADERNAHRLLQNSSLRGEWFYPTQEVLAFVLQKSPDFKPLIVENIHIDLRETRGTGVGIGRRLRRVVRPEGLSS